MAIHFPAWLHGILAEHDAFEGEILAAMQVTVLRGSGDYPGNEFIIFTGRDALLCRYFTGRHHLAESDQLTIERAILMDSNAGRAMTLGQTVRVTATAFESLNGVALDVIVK